MSQMLLTCASLLLATMGIGLVRALRGPTPADRLLALQLLGTSGIGVLLLLAAALEMPALNDVGLVFSLLAAVAVFAITRKRRHAPAASEAAPPTAGNTVSTAADHEQAA
ncbi:multiple resistance and pH regulation protein F [Rhabdochromatium marinum]|nr:monovalent cation/H+ antiporter complex subunit F [Rhabdochromatium marinum]MBK1647320.1 multiple resistance and pH regulation protein F [Rhabdochromatium marinum]